MNSACIIAACAANARRHNNMTPTVFQHGEEVYYKVVIRKYYRFKSCTIVVPDHENFSGSIYAPIRTLVLKPVQVPAHTMAIQNTFSVTASKCPDGIDAYVKNNWDTFMESRRWLHSDEEVQQEYENSISKKYNIEVKPGALVYTSSYFWEVK